MSELVFDNIDVYCNDIAEIHRFYCETLGLRLLYSSTVGSDWFAIQSGAVSVYFLAAPEAARDIHPPAGKAQGIASFSFAVKDLDTAIEKLDGRVHWTGDVSTWRHDSGTWYRYRFFVDPEGNNVS